MNNNNSLREHCYDTRDTALAAYLHSEGFELLDVDSSNFPTVFYFGNDNSQLSKFIRDFQVGKAIGNIAVFFRSYKIMLARIKEGKNT